MAEKIPDFEDIRVRNKTIDVTRADRRNDAVKKVQDSLKAYIRENLSQIDILQNERDSALRQAQRIAAKNRELVAQLKVRDQIHEEDKASLRANQEEFERMEDAWRQEVGRLSRNNASIAQVRRELLDKVDGFEPSPGMTIREEFEALEVDLLNTQKNIDRLVYVRDGLAEALEAAGVKEGMVSSIINELNAGWQKQHQKE